MKIGILTYHRANNYGAFLQAQSLCCRLNEEEGIDAELIDFSMSCEQKQYSLRNKLKTWIKNPAQIKFDIDLKWSFCKAFDTAPAILSKNSCISDSMKKFQRFVTGKYDIIIAGSDEIWKLDGFRGFPTPYWLPGELGCIKMTYAASSRSDFNSLSPEKKETLKKLIRDFSFIGLRDRKTYNEVSEFSENAEKLHMCCDPSFLYDFPIAKGSLYDVLPKTAGVDSNKKNVVLMTADKRVANYVYQNYHGVYNLISVFHWQKGFLNVGKLSPMQWLYAIKNADFVITTYFHATCFSIVFNTPFVAIGAKNKSEKLLELLNTPELQKRFIPDFEKFVKSNGSFSAMIKQDDYTNIVQAYRTEFDYFLATLRRY